MFAKGKMPKKLRWTNHFCPLISHSFCFVGMKKGSQILMPFNRNPFPKVLFGCFSLKFWRGW